MSQTTQSQFYANLKKYYTFYTGGFVTFVIIVGILEQLGVPNKVLGYLFLFATILLYAGIGFMSKTSEVGEYYVAGRRVPALFNGMATGADWMSAASFIGMAGTLYHAGFDGLAFVMGWTGGYCLVALFLAPYLRKFGQFTIPDFLGARFGGNIPRLIGVIAAITCSFTYVIAQIYGVGIITSRFTGLEFGVGVFVGLAGILVCSFLGGMKAVTWTQVAQYIILIVAYMIPVVWLAVKQTGVPLPQIVAYTTVLPKVDSLAKEFNDKATPKGAKEEEVRAIFRDRAAAADAKLKGLETGGANFLAEEKGKLSAKVAELKAAPAPDVKAIEAAEKAVKDFPADPAAAKAAWTKDKAGNTARAAPTRIHSQAYPGKDEAAQNKARKNFLALVMCLMVGTAALPHILMRYYTTPSVKEARVSVFWSLFFIFLLYFTAPSLAVLVKGEVYGNLVGSSFASLPAWVSNWATVDKTLMNISDINKDGIVQLAEIVIGGDLVVLATPEIAGLPYVISGLVAAGGLAAALSTAAGLLMAISAAVSHDLVKGIFKPDISDSGELMAGKISMAIAIVIAGYLGLNPPGFAAGTVALAFGIAASSLFPAIMMGIFSKKMNKEGAIAGMIAGLAITLFYVFAHKGIFFIKGTDFVGAIGGANSFFGITPEAFGAVGALVNFIVAFVVDKMTKEPPEHIQHMVENVRIPRGSKAVDGAH